MEKSGEESLKDQFLKKEEMEFPFIYKLKICIQRIKVNMLSNKIIHENTYCSIIGQLYLCDIILIVIIVCPGFQFLYVVLCHVTMIFH